MNPELIKSIIIEGQELIGELEAVNREFEWEDFQRYVFVGIRQSGKSYMLYLRALQLIADGFLREQMVFINFDDERLLNFTAKDFDLILKTYSSIFEYKPVLFLDEIQNIDGWEHFARRLSNQKYDVYITGSNAKMLSKDISTKLGGRYVEKYVFPYSFKEYLVASGCTLRAEWKYGKQRGEVERLLEAYFQWGGFPELLLFKNKRSWLNQLYDKIILGDIIQRNKIKNEIALKLLLSRLAENIKTPTSLNRLTSLVKATGVSTNVASVTAYINYCIDACLLFPLTNYASKFVERNTIRKHYFIDNGLLHIFLNDSDTALLENICAVTLYKKSVEDERYKMYFYNNEVELDFYLPELSKGIQSSFSIDRTETFEREIKSLVVFHQKYGLKEAEIVTRWEEMEIEREGLKIRVVPLSKWLLDDSF